MGKQTQIPLSQPTWRTMALRLRTLHTVHSTRIASEDKDVMVLADASYWGMIYGVLVFKNTYRGKILIAKIYDQERDYHRLSRRCRAAEMANFKIRKLICNGLQEFIKHYRVTGYNIVHFIK